MRGSHSLGRTANLMKVTKTASAAASERMARKVAEQGCNVCPCCGETRSWVDVVKAKGDPLSQGIFDYPLHGYVKTGFLRGAYMTVTNYECHTCGARWESEPY